MITCDDVRQYFDYDPSTGVMKRTCKPDRWGNILPHDYEPSSISSGYRTANFKGKVYKIHRLIWLYVYGNFPENDLDHINGDRLDNRLCNLRSVTRSQNTQNRGVGKNNKTGCIGVNWESNVGKYRVRISVNGERKCLGFFTDLTEAVKTRKEAEHKYGFHENHNERESWRK